MNEMNTKPRNGFAVIAIMVGTFFLTTVIIAPKVASVDEFFAVRSAAGELAENLREAERLSIGHDVDRRIRITGERGYVREKRAGAGWLFEEAYVLPEGMELDGPGDIVFVSRSALGPVALYTITGPNSFSRTIATKKNRMIEAN